MPELTKRSKKPASAKASTALVPFPGGRELAIDKPFVVGFKGLGTKLHLWVMVGEDQYVSACDQPEAYYRPRTSGIEDIKRWGPVVEGARVDCWCCAKAVGLIDRFPGRAERLRLERGWEADRG